MVSQNLISQYSGDVSKALNGSGKYGKTILKNLEADLQDFLIDNPDATEADIRKHFGSPADYAAEYARMHPEDAIFAKKRFYKSITAIVLGTAVIALVGLFVYYHINLASNLTSNTYYHIENIS